MLITLPAVFAVSTSVVSVVSVVVVDSITNWVVVTSTSDTTMEGMSVCVCVCVFVCV